MIRMKRFLIYILPIYLLLMVGCSDEKFPSINHHQSFVASMNILEPSMTFYDDLGDEIAEWKFEKSYTGALLIPHDRVLLYGKQLPEADIYELSSGKHLATIDTGLGITNSYYDEESKLIFMTNSETNTVTSYNQHGEKFGECQLGEYPMSMDSYNGLLYVVNYKDTKLSVVNIDTMTLQNEWSIEKSSNGILVLPEEGELWIGGHGEGSKPNQTVDVHQLKTGELIDQINVSIMPVEFARNGQEIYIINHGANELYVTNSDGETLWANEVGANPFAVASFQEKIVVAGFDDNKLYFIDRKEIRKTVDTGNGPFQLLVREVK